MYLACRNNSRGDTVRVKSKSRSREAAACNDALTALAGKLDPPALLDAPNAKEAL